MAQRAITWGLMVGLLAAAGACGGSSGVHANDGGAVGAGTGGGAAGRGGTAGSVGQPMDGATSTPDVAMEAPSGSGGGAGGGAGATPRDAAATPPDAAMESAPAETASACTPCTDYAPATKVGQVTAAALDQLSGIAVSHRNAGVLFVHNDHTATEFWAVSEAGAVLATFNYTGVTVRDVEDIAVGPCPTGTCVYLADIGGNLAPRPDYTIVRVPEPAVATNGSAAPVSIAAERLVFTYPDGALHNAESLLIEPRGGALYIIDKVAAGKPSTAYKLTGTFGGAASMATKMGELPVPAATDMPATAADAHPCGTGFILATGNTAYEFRIPAGAPFEDAFKATPVAVPVAQEQQREGVSYQPDGRGFFTNSEGAMQPINHTGCR